jgi:UDP:flavonoid glycosyltransferase YjiC (YdhE family)
VLRDAGIPYDIVGPRMDERRSARFVRSGVGMGNVNQSMYTDDELRTYARAEAAYFERHQVTVAVTGFTLTALLSTRLAGIKLVTEHAGCWVPPSYERGLLPAPTSVRPPLLRVLPERIVRKLANAGPPRLHYYCAGFNRVAAELGIQGVPSLPALLLGDLTLVPEAPEVLGIPADELAAWTPAGNPAYWPSTRMRYSGPLYAQFGDTLPHNVTEFLAGPGPIIYVAITSSPAELVRGVIAALTALPDARILVAATVHDPRKLATVDDPSGLAKPHPRVLIEGVLPSHLVMPRVDLAVTAGGQGSVQTAMAAGTPLLGIPLQPEQDLNVALLERQGAARRVAVRHAHTARLTDAARTMLADASYRSAARRIQRIYQGIDGPGMAADAIIALSQASTGRDARCVVQPQQ